MLGLCTYGCIAGRSRPRLTEDQPSILEWVFLMNASIRRSPEDLGEAQRSHGAIQFRDELRRSEILDIVIESCAIVEEIHSFLDRLLGITSN